MSLQTKVIGRQPTDHGPYDPELAYGKKFQCTLFGCAWESLRDNNNTAPAVWDGGDTITPNLVDWKKVSGSYEAWLMNHDKPATSEQYPFNGMGRIRLQKNLVEVEEGGETVTKNLLTQAMFEDGEGNPLTNTVYVIQYDFTLGEDITVPANCILEFDGGSISGAYTITGTNTGIDAGLVKIFNTNVILAGSWNVVEAYPEWYGAKGDGTTDDSEAIQKAFNYFNNIYFPSSTYALAQVLPQTNNTIVFSEGCHIKASRPLIDTAYNDGHLGESMFSIHGVENVTIIGNKAKVDMRRSDYPEEERGQSRHCFRMLSAQNVYIENIEACNGFGDGFCIGYPLSNSNGNKNITLRGCISDNNRRQGLTIADGMYLFIEDCIFKNTNGTSPSAGIDIESNYDENLKYSLDYIYITNCNTEGNAGPSIAINGKLCTKDEWNNNHVHIYINNLISRYDGYGFALYANYLQDCDGIIEINNATVYSEKFLNINYWGSSPNVPVKFNNCNHFKNHVLTNNSIKYNCSISIIPTSAQNNNYFGDIHFTNFSFFNLTNQKSRGLFYVDISNVPSNIKHLKNITFENTYISDINEWVSTDNVVTVENIQDVDFENVNIDISTPILKHSPNGPSNYVFSHFCYAAECNFKLPDVTPYLKNNTIVTIEKYVPDDGNFDGSGECLILPLNTNIKLYKADGTEINYIRIDDPELIISGSRKDFNKEYIKLIARPKGWVVYDISKGFDEFTNGNNKLVTYNV